MFQSRGDSGVAPSQWTVRVKAWVIEAFAPPETTSVLVTELTCTEPGCPPLETVIALLAGPEGNRQYKIQRPLADITRADVLALANGVTACIDH